MLESTLVRFQACLALYWKSGLSTLVEFLGSGENDVYIARYHLSRNCHIQKQV